MANKEIFAFENCSRLFEDKFEALKDYSNNTIWREMSIGYSIQMGFFDNEIQHFEKYLPMLRNIYVLQEKFIR